MIEVKIECEACDATGLHRFHRQLEKVAVLCRDCQGAGHVMRRYKPFTKRATMTDIDTVYRHVVMGTTRRPYTVTYDEFQAGKMP